MAAILGLDAKLYYQSSGTRAAWPGAGAAPNLVEVGNARDVTANLTKGEADVTVRANDGWRATIGTLKDGGADFEMIYDSADAAFTAIQEAFLTDATLAFAILDGVAATVGTQGLWADFKVTAFTVNQALEDAIKVNVTIKPTYSAVAPEWITTA